MLNFTYMPKDLYKLDPKKGFKKIISLKTWKIIIYLDSPYIQAYQVVFKKPSNIFWE